MSDERAPGVFVEEVSYRSRTIAGVPLLPWALALLEYSRRLRRRSIKSREFDDEAPQARQCTLS